MQSKHGALEGAILTTLWNLEEKGIVYNSVKDVFENMNKTNKEKRAYTTVKTVMDRLATKKVLIREKRSKKFLYKTACSNYDMVKTVLNEVSQKYCSGDLSKLYAILETMQTSKKLVKV